MGDDTDEDGGESSYSYASSAHARIPEQQTVRVSTDTRYRILSSERRRHPLSYLFGLADAGVIEFDPVAETMRYVGSEAVTALPAATHEIVAQEE